MTEAASSYLSGTSLRSKVEINWGAGPFDNPTSGWVDVTSDVLSFRARRGRPSENQATPPGSATIVFNDRDGSYDPTLNELGGPNAPDVVPGRRVRVNVSDVGATIEALRPDFYFPVSLAESVTASGTLVGVMQPGPLAFQRIDPSGNSNMPQRVEGQWLLQNGAFPTVIAAKPHVLEDRNGTRIEQGAYIRTDCTAQFGTSSGVAWVNTQSTDETFFCGQHESFRVGIDTSGKAVLDVWLDSQWERVESTTTIRDALNWYMVAWTIVYDDVTDEVQVRLWVNGTFEAGGEGTGTVSTSTTERVVVAHMEDDDTLSNGNVWDGELCDVAFWAGYTLTDPQIERLYRMSSAGLPVFNGHVLSWQVEPRETPIGNARVVVECGDVGQALTQVDLRFDPRRLLLELEPEALFTFDDESGADLLGGPQARLVGGVEFQARERRGEERIALSTATGVSAGALTLTPSPNVLDPRATVQWPAPTVVPKAFSFWLRAASPDSQTVQLADGSQRISGTFFDWRLELNTSGRLQLWQEIDGDPPTVWEGTQTITNDRWRFIFVLVGSTTTAVFVDGVQDATSTAAGWNVPVKATFGGRTIPVGIDEYAFWYDNTPTIDTLFEIYEAGGNRYRNQLAHERAAIICELARWTGPKQLSLRADSRCGPLSDGNAWKLLQDTAVTEGGTVNVNADNELVFEGRHDRRRYGALADSELADSGLADLTFTTDDRYLHNEVIVDNDTVAQDAQSISAYGRRVLSLSPQLASSNFRQARAEGLVKLYKDYQPRTDTLRWELPSMFGAAGLLAEVNDMVTVSRTVFPDSASAAYVQDCWIELVEISVDAETKRASVEAQLSAVDPEQNAYWTLDTSLFDGSDVLGW